MFWGSPAAHLLNGRGRKAGLMLVTMTPTMIFSWSWSLIVNIFFLERQHKPSNKCDVVLFCLVFPAEIRYVATNFAFFRRHIMVVGCCVMGLLRPKVSGALEMGSGWACSWRIPW